MTEFFSSCEYFKNYCGNSIPSIRYQARRLDVKIVFLVSTIQFPTIKSVLLSNCAAGGIWSVVDEKGCFDGGFSYINGIAKSIKSHTDTGTILNGSIPKWNEIEKVVELFGKQFPQLQYLGFDFVIDQNDTVKILEINSLTSYDAYNVIYLNKNNNVSRYFKQLV